MLDAEIETEPLKAEVASFDIENLTEHDFEILWAFSKEVWKEKSESNEILLKLKGKKKEKINLQLLDNLKQWRELLLNNLKKHPQKNKYDFEKDMGYIEEEAQKFIDRLIFICYCEDKQLTEVELKPIISDKESDRHWDKSGYLLERLRKLFEMYNQKYNSDLFAKNWCDDFYFDDGALLSVLKDLRQPKGKLPYDFSIIEADILGKAYENFLGHIISGQKRFKEKESKGKRKEMGIYYTPTYIVDYIVRNTVGEYIKGKAFSNINKVKILDPACGSGSFLIRAFDILAEESRKALGRELNYEEKKNLMLNCIHGVDKDERAVDICKLNLSLKLAEKGQLPELHNNIKCGDSLIDDENIAGDKAFNWNEKFKSIMDNGGFDVVIGNPPYGADLEEKDRTILENKFKLGNTDTACLFIGLSILLLRSKGINGFIVPKPFVYSSTWENVREKLLEGLTEIVDCSKVWKEVKLEQVIYFFIKNNPTKSYNSCVRKKEKIEHVGEINKDTFREFGFLLNGISDRELKIGRKIKNAGISLNNFMINQRGAMYQKEITDKKSDFKVLGGAQIGRYYINSEIKGHISKKLIQDDKAYVRDNSILVQNIVAHIENPTNNIKIIATLPKFVNTKDYIVLDTINQLKNKNDFASEVTLSILNSKLMNWYMYRFIFGKAIRTMHFDNSVTDRIPIPKIDKNNQLPFINLADKMLSLNKKLQEIGDKSTLEKKKIEEEIKKTDNEIDELVYKLYGITEEEKKIVEEALK